MPNQQYETARPTASASPNPSGRRPRGPDHFRSEELALAFAGLPEGDTHHEIGDLLKSVGKTIGWTRALIEHFQFLLDWTRAGDWISGSQPIVWLSVRETASRLGISSSQVRRNERALHQLGAISWKDSPNHRRFGFRDPDGIIKEAWGINLAPSASLVDELRSIAQSADTDRGEARRLRNVLAAARSDIYAAIRTAESAACLPSTDAEAWRRLTATASGKSSCDMSLPTLRRRLRELQHIDAELRAELARDTTEPDPVPGAGEPLPDDDFVPDMLAKAVSGDCRGTHPCLPPFDYNTNDPCFERNTVGQRPCRQGERLPQARPSQPFRRDSASATAIHGTPVGALLAILPDSIRLRLPPLHASWSDLIDAARFAALDLGVSQDAWGEACSSLGRDGAAVALAVVAVKHERGLVNSPGGYLRALARRAVTGELHLERSVFALLDKKNGAALAGRQAPGSTAR